VCRETAVLVGGPRALLLQLAHPAVAAGVEQHSDYQSDALARGKRTFEAMCDIAFGDLDTALEVGRRVGHRHERVRGVIAGSGRPYHATDPELALWVLATLIDTTLHMFSVLVRPLSPAERQRYYVESLRTADLFGIPRERMPRDVEAFDAYVAAVLDGDTLAVGPFARAQLEFLRAQPISTFVRAVLVEEVPWSSVLDLPLIRSSTMSLIQLVTAGLLPAPLRQAYGFPWGRRRQALYRSLLSALGTAYRALPGRVRFHPAYHHAMRRLT
jgi:uncharacterized protein (DUF2236 family)